ncbi:hypothetical protein MUK42_12231 [Musa troglodytarum]|uniref:Uncharacterized protein n=1 Tax=Musa troglodytarum TaxID=320322 RepID=A0A9E7GP20_9LILI|nr:hypothetical protein MUK42_12231 [Musa troglodytarum]
MVERPTSIRVHDTKDLQWSLAASSIKGKVDEMGGRPLGVGVITGALEKSGSSIGAETDSSYKDLGVSLKPMNSRTRIHTCKVEFTTQPKHRSCFVNLERPDAVIHLKHNSHGPK